MPTITPRVISAAEQLLPAGVRGAQHARLVTDGAQAIDLAADIVATGRGPVTGELFGITKGPVLDALKLRASAGDGVRMLADPEMMKSKMFRKLSDWGIELESWGGNGLKKGNYVRSKNPRKVHAKLLHGPESTWISTASLMRVHDTSADVAMELTGRSRDAARRLTRLAMDGDEVGLVRASIDAANEGVLLNDAALGVSHLTRVNEALIAGAQHELLIATKIVDDVHYASLLAAARDRGVSVTLVTHGDKTTDKAVRRALDGVEMLSDPYGILHANVVVADGTVAAFGSAHASPRALGRSTAARQSHEIGVVTDDPAAVAKLREFVLSVPGVPRA